MAGGKQSPLTAIILVVVIVCSLAFVVKRLIPKRTQRPAADWTCESCDYRFIAPYPKDMKPLVCPKCGGEAVQTHYYYCSVHDKVFEGYRSKYDLKSSGHGDPAPDIAFMPHEAMLYKIPGEEWTNNSSIVMNITCPLGNSDQSTISYCPPRSERRKKKR